MTAAEIEAWEAAPSGEELREAIQFALDCWNAAISEGLYDLIPEDDDSPTSLAGLFARRLNHIVPRLRAALSASPAPKSGDGV